VLEIETQRSLPVETSLITKTAHHDPYPYELPGGVIMCRAPGMGIPGRELELIQSHMAQKPVLRGEVGCACVAREVSVERGGRR